jgi:hypothetical protein
MRGGARRPFLNFVFFVGTGVTVGIRLLAIPTNSVMTLCESQKTAS